MLFFILSINKDLGGSIKIDIPFFDITLKCAINEIWETQSKKKIYFTEKKKISQSRLF